jgi:four helix bundle protein
MNEGLAKFGAYQKSRELFEHVADDMELIATHPLCRRMVSQHMASADSICSNIEEGYGRESSREYRHYLIIARGSARETQGRYSRFARWLPSERVAPRVALCEEIIRILSATIVRLTPHE